MFENFWEIVDILSSYFSSNFGNDNESRLLEMAAATGQAAGKGNAASGLAAQVESAGKIIDGAIKELDPLWSGDARTAFDQWLTANYLDAKSRTDLVQHLDEAHTVLIEAAQATLKTKQACEHLITSVEVAIAECIGFSLLMGWAGPFFAAGRIAIIAGEASSEAGAIVKTFYAFIRIVARLFAELSKLLTKIPRLTELTGLNKLAEVADLGKLGDVITASKDARLAKLASFSDMSNLTNVTRLGSRLTLAGGSDLSVGKGAMLAAKKFAINYFGSATFGWVAGGTAGAIFGAKDPYHVSVEGLSENLLASDVAGPLGPMTSSEAQVDSSILHSFQRNVRIGFAAGSTGTALITGLYQGKPLGQVVKQTAEIGLISGVFNGSVGLAFPDSNALIGQAVRNADDWNLAPLHPNAALADQALVPTVELPGGSRMYVTDPTTPGYTRLPGGDNMPIVPNDAVPWWSRTLNSQGLAGNVARTWGKVPTFIQGNVLGLAPNIINRQLVPFSPSQPAPQFNAADLTVPHTANTGAPAEQNMPENPIPIIGQPHTPPPTTPPPTTTPPTTTPPTTTPPTTTPPTTTPPTTTPPTTTPPTTTPPTTTPPTTAPPTAPPVVPAPPVQPPPPPTVGGFTVTVQPFGQENHYGSLWDIADNVYGDGTLWTEIYDANRESIGSDANYVQVGRQIYVPAIPRQKINH